MNKRVLIHGKTCSFCGLSRGEVMNIPSNVIPTEVAEAVQQTGLIAKELNTQKEDGGTTYRINYRLEPPLPTANSELIRMSDLIKELTQENKLLKTGEISRLKSEIRKLNNVIESKDRQIKKMLGVYTEHPTYKLLYMLKDLAKELLITYGYDKQGWECIHYATEEAKRRGDYFKSKQLKEAISTQSTMSNQSVEVYPNRQEK